MRVRREDGQIVAWQLAVLFSDDAAQFAAMQRLTQRHAELLQQKEELVQQQRAADSAADKAAADLAGAEKGVARLARQVCNANVACQEVCFCIEERLQLSLQTDAGACSGMLLA